MMILQAQNLYKSYTPKGRERIDILKGVSISVSEREMLSIIGASGSGKTTLLNILGTLDTADDGETSLQIRCHFLQQEISVKPRSDCAVPKSAHWVRVSVSSFA
jgi:lipoprotein-releasing system ATP-binding protein